MRTAIGRVGLGLLLCGLPGLVAAQDAASPPAPATLAYLEGGVDLDHEGVSDLASAPTLLLDGDRLRTRDGRAEVVFADGSLLHIDRGTQVEWLGPGRVRLLEGRVSLRLSASAAPYLVDTAPGTVRLEPRGEYTLSLGGPELQLSIVRGVGELDGASERVIVRGGETLVVDNGGRPTLRRYNSARFDDFTRWAYDRANGGAYGASAQYLPPEIRAYGSSFDGYGRWDYVAPHGYVWYPSVVTGWRPYAYGGGWRHTRYGWTWYAGDRWSHVTHHYGRWGFSGASWFWIPGNVWGPAWVSWAYGPGVISWSPLGWNSQPVFGYWDRPLHPAYDPWRAWTVIPRRHFGYRGPVQSWMLDGRRLPDQSRRAFVRHAAAPPPPVGSVARGDYAVPRPSRASGRPELAEGRGSFAGANAAPSSSWSQPTPVPGGVRRQPRAYAPAPAATPPPDTTSPVRRGPAPEVRDTAPAPMPRPVDPRTQSEYAVPRRAPDGGFRREDSEVFRGRDRARQPEPSSVGGQSSGQSWQRPSEPSRSRAGQDGAVERSRPRGDGRTSGPPPQSRPSNGEGSSGTSRGASRRPPPRN